ncbi:putative major facilitator superfamily transporter protein [Lasiodiplodia theobromae]|nr:putative major facilitator superfamily transporter protein [Lasiodiplodia theobromae]
MAHITAAARLKIAMTRPFLMATEPIIMLWTLYLSIIYIILFTFLDGYPYIYQETYGITQGLTNVIFVAMDAGVVSILVVVPFVYRHTAHKVKAKQSTPEDRLWYAMVTAPAISISLFWMGWTARPSISIWSPMIASFLFGYGTTGVFISTYMYIIDSYEMYSASALTLVAVVRYIAAGGMTVAGLPIYEGLGVAYTCTILACASAVMVPVPYVLYRYGHHVRSKSKFAVSSEHESESA